MITQLGAVTLKSGESAEILKITAPEPDWEEPVRSRLAHKSSRWHQPMSRALREGLPGLTMNFFLLRVGEATVGTLTVVQALKRPVALLQHVFTDPDHRRKGICSYLMRALQDDFLAEGGQAMYLGTGYDTPPFWIYHSCGFRPIGTIGAMVWVADQDYSDSYFAPAETLVRASQWGDWPLLHALYQLEKGWDLRGFSYGQFGNASYESAFCELEEAIEAAEAQQSMVIESQTSSAVVGHAFLARDRKWPDGPWVLDLFVHPSFSERGSDLLDALQLPVGVKIQAYCDDLATDRAALLQSRGFSLEATLTGQYVNGQGLPRDVLLYSLMP
ncbi:MAG: GNAT family N-acetyltransferase [candidate division WS1 bacterium]|nr:GNAT family N-acetyltransferase [candidate division WS1 bacterium]